MSDATTVDRLSTALADTVYPVSKGQLVDHASCNNGDEDTVHALHAIPDRPYVSFDEVLSVVAVDQRREA
jgi:hypothetical protein